MISSPLDRLLDPLAASFTEQQAEQILNWHPDAELKDRIDYLRDAANEGQLSAEEDAEYKQLIEDFDMIAIIQAKARQSHTKDVA